MIQPEYAGIKEVEIFSIETEFIKLDALLKAANLAASGGEAKFLISSGEVSVNGEMELRRGRKIYPGYLVSASGSILQIEKTS